MLGLFLTWCKEPIYHRKFQPLYSVQQQRGAVGTQVTNQEPLKRTVNLYISKKHKNHMIISSNRQQLVSYSYHW